jgi:aspartyl-tRNA(Asn)/glutamyl-tRNA(Gln) amidotransferase subunit B
LRCDVNISIRKEGEEEFGTRAEIKNMNSLNFIAKAMDYEFKRQVDILESGGRVVQETRRYNNELNITESMRGKEDADDYRYFRDPDLVTISIKNEEIELLRDSLPELPHTKLQRFKDEYGLPESDAELLVKYKRIAEFFEASCKGIKNYKMVSNFIIGQIFRRLSTELEKEEFNISIDAELLNELVALTDDKKITTNMARNTLEQMLDTGKGPREFLSESDLEGIDEKDLKLLCEKAIAANEKAVKQYLNGKEKAFKSIIGYIMKETKGKADAELAGDIVRDLIKN